MLVPFLPHHLPDEVTKLGILSYPPPHALHSFIHSFIHSIITEPLPKAYSKQPSEKLVVSPTFLTSVPWHILALPRDPFWKNSYSSFKTQPTYPLPLKATLVPRGLAHALCGEFPPQGLCCY